MSTTIAQAIPKVADVLGPSVIETALFTHPEETVEDNEGRVKRGPAILVEPAVLAGNEALGIMKIEH